MSKSLLDLSALLSSWQLALRSEHKSPATIATYTEGVLGFLRWCADTGTAPELTKANLQAFMAAILEAGWQPATARTRHMALRTLRTALMGRLDGKNLRWAVRWRLRDRRRGAPELGSPLTG